jgi:hypothetical protein
MARLRLNGAQHLKGSKNSLADARRPHRQRCGLSHELCSQDVWGGDPINRYSNRMDTSANGDDEDVGKVNPNLIDLSGTTLHVGCQRMTQNQQENRNDICG